MMKAVDSGGVAYPSEGVRSSGKRVERNIEWTCQGTQGT